MQGNNYLVLFLISIFTLLVKKVKAKWILLAVKRAFAVNVLFPPTTGFTVSESMALKVVFFFWSFLLCIYLQSDGIGEPKPVCRCFPSVPLPVSPARPERLGPCRRAGGPHSSLDPRSGEKRSGRGGGRAGSAARPLSAPSGGPRPDSAGPARRPARVNRAGDTPAPGVGAASRGRDGRGGWVMAGPSLL